jgi:threonine dehydratase
VKRTAIAAHGANVDATQPGYDAAEAAARTFARETQGTFISPCTGRALLAGQGTVGLEILTDLPNVGTIIICVGGGGLCGGIGGYVRGTAPGVRLLGAQSIRTNAMTLALAAGHAVKIPDLPTLADGLAGAVDDEMYQQGKASLDAIATVEEEEIESAMEWLGREEGVTAEGAGAVGVAAIMRGRLKPMKWPAAITVSGQNRR